MTDTMPTVTIKTDSQIIHHSLTLELLPRVGDKLNLYCSYKDERSLFVVTDILHEITEYCGQATIHHIEITVEEK